jgi:nitroimidazol reductase NimA-like FMN-containing flavoprotein (pyridoxamine 5'-phosphate oxidase superfamily)
MTSMEVDRNGLEVLDRRECLRLLATASVGRVGLTSGSLPRILPVNFWLVGDRIVIRTRLGSKLEAALRNAVVAFEADDFDVVDHSGWSVLVTGMASEIADSELDDADRLQVPHRVPGRDGRLVAISTGLVSGRRIVAGHTDDSVLPGNRSQDQEPAR